MSLSTRLGLAAGALLLATSAQATTLEITVSSNQPAEGLFFTPFFLAFHDGNYDTFNPGEAPSQGVEDIAETGNPTAQVNAAPAGVATTVVGNANGFGGAPVFDPGESTTITFEVSPTSQRYLSFLSMVIPSNDAFLGNPNPLQYELFDAAGNFLGPRTINILGRQVWDAGTEANDNLGAAFNAAGGAETETNDGVSLLGDLSVFENQNTAAGTTVTAIPGANDVLASISVNVAPVPVPASLPLLGAAVLGFGLVARRRQA